MLDRCVVLALPQTYLQKLLLSAVLRLAHQGVVFVLNAQTLREEVLFLNRFIECLEVVFIASRQIKRRVDD